jgi:hypothetical protein
LVEKTRLESYSELPQAAGWVKAETQVAANEPQMARDYAERTRGGD